MENITSIKKKLIDSKLKSKPFSSGMYAFLMFFGKSLDFNFLYFTFLIFLLVLNLIDLNYIWKNNPLKSGSYFKRSNYYGIFLLLSIIIGSQFNV